MFWLIVGVIVGIICIIFFCKDPIHDFEEKILGSIIIVLICAIFTLVALAFSSVTLGLSDSLVDYELKDKSAIVYVVDNVQENEKQYISMKKEQGSYYYFYYKEDKYGATMEKVAVELSYIQYSDSDYRIETYKPVFTSNVAKFFAISPMTSNKYVFCCPYGSVQDDLENVLNE